jgi:hypothetical protein
MGSRWLFNEQMQEHESKIYQGRLKELVPDVINGKFTRSKAIEIAEYRTKIMQKYTEDLEYHPDYSFLHITSYDCKNPQHRAVLKELYEASDNYNDAELEF